MCFVWETNVEHLLSSISNWKIKEYKEIKLQDKTLKKDCRLPKKYIYFLAMKKIFIFFNFVLQYFKTHFIKVFRDIIAITLDSNK